MSLVVGEDGRPYVGTGAEGRIYTVDEFHNSVLIADTEERQISALVMSGKQRFVAASDPAVLHPVRGTGGPDAVWTSKVLDAGSARAFRPHHLGLDGSDRDLDAHRQHQGSGRRLERLEQADRRSRRSSQPARALHPGARALEPRPRGGARRGDDPVSHRQPARGADRNRSQLGRQEIKEERRPMPRPRGLRSPAARSTRSRRPRSP